MQKKEQEKNINDSWLKEFDERFNFLFKSEDAIVYTSRRSIKGFISQILSRQKQQIIKEIEKWAKEEIDNCKTENSFCEFCFALKKLLSKLKNLNPDLIIPIKKMSLKEFKKKYKI